MARLILVRHGQTEWNRIERFRGRADLALNETGVKQAEAVAERLSGWNVAAVYSSPLRRALMTAEIIGSRLGLLVQPLDGLIDINYGKWQGLSPAEAAKQDADLYTRWLERPHEVVFPQGESLQDVRLRIEGVIAEMLDKHSDQTVSLVSHVVVCRVFICTVLGLDNSHFWQIGQDTGAINVIETRGAGLALTLLNDTCHLKNIS